MAKKRGRKPVWPPHIHHHKSGRDRIRVGETDYWLGPTGSEEAKKEYARLVVELAKEDGAPVPKKAGWPTLAELAREFLKEQAPTYSAKEQGHYRHAVAVLLRGGRAGVHTDAFGVAELTQVRDDMLKAKKRTTFASRKEGAAPEKVGWSRNHINRQITRIRTLWRWAEERGRAPKGSWNHLRTLRCIPRHDHKVRHTKKVVPAYREHLDRFLPRIRSWAVRSMLELQCVTGMRSGEVRQMRPLEIDRSGDIWLYRPRQHKNAWRDQERVIPLGPEAQKILEPWLEVKKPRDLLFLTRGGVGFSSEAYGLAASRAARKVGFDWFRPYCLRHGAKQRLTREHGLDAARAILGQKHIGTTNDYGDALDLTLATEVARKAC